MILIVLSLAFPTMPGADLRRVAEGVVPLPPVRTSSSTELLLANTLFLLERLGRVYAAASSPPATVVERRPGPDRGEEDN